MSHKPIVFSPWGHPVNSLKEAKSATSVLETTFSLRPFEAADFRFLSRDDNRIQAALERGSPVGQTGLSTLYEPGRDDQLFFKDKKDYEEKLTRIRDLTSYIAGILKRAGLISESEEALDLTDESVHLLASKDAPAASILLAEFDILRKFTVQRFIQPYWYIDSFQAKNPAVLTEHKTILDAILASIYETRTREEAKAVSDESLAADPLDTNAGAPEFSSELAYRVKLLNHLKGAGKNWQKDEAFKRLDDRSHLMMPTTVAESIKRLSDIYALPSTVVTAVGINRRFGPSRKTVPLWHHTNDDVVAGREASNLPRMRHVFMAPYYLNLLMSPLMIQLKRGRLAHAGLWHDDTTSEHKRAVIRSITNNGGIVFESDVSGLDRNMGLSHRLYFYERMLELFNGKIGFTPARIAQQAHYLSLLIPDYKGAHAVKGVGLEAIPNKEGVGLYSGIKLTSEIDSFVVIWVTALAAVRSGLTTIDKIRSGQWFKTDLFFNQGDDVLMGIKQPAYALRFQQEMRQAYDEFGLSARLQPGYRFLMRHRTAEADYPVVARILQQTLSNEKIAKTTELALLGFCARSQGWPELIRFIDGLPESDFKTGLQALNKEVKDLLLTTPLLNGQDDLPTILDSGSSAGLTAAARELGLTIAVSADQTSQIEQLIADLIKDQYSTSARELAQALTEIIQIKQIWNVQVAQAEQFYLHAMATLGMR